MNIELEIKFKEKINKIVDSIDRKRFDQEPAYVGALLSRLDGIDLTENGERLTVRSTIVSDRGRKSAESIYGADFAIILEMYDGIIKIEKAILGQAKKGVIKPKNNAIPTGLKEQINKMAMYTESILVMETPSDDLEKPRVRMQKPKQDTLETNTYDIGSYILDYFIKCKHGDKRETFVRAVEDSNLSKLKIMINN